jgi:NAD(P)-dependent dehydrogenase (short-subunit alcohol dehydrogenase family)
MDWSNQTAVVTGGSRGLGLGAVEALVERGAKITVVARTQDDLDAVAQRLGATVAADVTDRGAALRVLGDWLRRTIAPIGANSCSRPRPRCGPICIAIARVSPARCSTARTSFGTSSPAR